MRLVERDEMNSHSGSSGGRIELCGGPTSVRKSIQGLQATQSSTRSIERNGMKVPPLSPRCIMGQVLNFHVKAGSVFQKYSFVQATSRTCSNRPTRFQCCPDVSRVGATCMPPTV